MWQTNKLSGQSTLYFVDVDLSMEKKNIKRNHMFETISPRLLKYLGDNKC